MSELPFNGTPYDVERISAHVDEISRELLIKEPYFGHLFVGTVRTML